DAPSTKRLIVIGEGGKDAGSRQPLREDWLRIARQAAEGFGFQSIDALVWPEASSSDSEDAARQAAKELTELAKGGGRAVIVPFHLGKKLDSMMAFSGYLQGFIPKGAEFLDGDVTPHPAVSLWMRREMNRRLLLEPGDIGVVFLAHGADYHWNETMRQAVAPLQDRYKIELAFSMADQPVVERAVRRLEERGVRAIVIVRVFGLASSFQGTVERMIGLDVEGESRTSHVHGHDHHGHGPAPSVPSPRIRSAAVLATVGGVEAHPLFAKALLDRAAALSRDRSKETVILVAHGAGRDSDNERWVANLRELAARIRADGGGDFRAIRVGTWREDWPEKREAWVRDIRAMVQEAAKDGGRAIVVPARTAGRGPEREFLEGLEYALAEGFAPHPLFAKWFEDQIREGMAKLAAAPGGEHPHHLTSASGPPKPAGP
ncbi:MAG: cobalamin biosynthesis protein CbiX, partial [Bdellovibrionota bacterium]